MQNCVLLSRTGAASDLESYLNYQEVNEWKDEMESIVQEILADCWQAWYSADFDGTAGSPLAREGLVCEQEVDRLRPMHVCYSKAALGLANQRQGTHTRMRI